MKKIILVLMLINLLLIFGCNNPGISQDQNIEKIVPNNIKSIMDLPVEDLSNDEIVALNLTINDEFRAEAIYQKVIAKFGEVKPFINIINAEKKHSSALAEIYDKYSLTVPNNDWYAQVPEFDSVRDACQAGVDAEIENVALYDDLFKKVDNQDIVFVFKSLRDASEYNHLPAFERCAER